MLSVPICSTGMVRLRSGFVFEAKAARSSAEALSLWSTFISLNLSNCLVRSWTNEDKLAFVHS